MDHLVAIYRAGKVAEILRRKQGKLLETDTNYERAVIVTGRPDIVVGDAWPPTTKEDAIKAGKLERYEHPTDNEAVRVPTKPTPVKGA